MEAHMRPSLHVLCVLTLCSCDRDPAASPADASFDSIDVAIDAPAVVFDPTYLKASNTTALDAVGLAGAVAGDGTTIAVGAPGEGSSATGVNGNQSDDSATYAG